MHERLVRIIIPEGQLVEIAKGSPEFAELINQALGSELRLVREENGWCRDQLATRSHLDSNKIRSVEDGESPLTMRQFFDLCDALRAHPIDLFTKSLQRGGIWLGVNELQVDLTKALNYKPLAWLHTWASSQQADHKGWITLYRTELLELAKANGCEWRELLTHLFAFIPDERLSFEQFLAEQNERFSKNADVT